MRQPPSQCGPRSVRPPSNPRQAPLLDRLFRLENFGIKLGLENIALLCEALGHPERTFDTLHVAGTNGKGSVTSMAHATLVAAGVPAARYTSPHLVDITERFVIGEKAVDADTFQAAAQDVLDTVDRARQAGVLSVTPTFFEVTTAIAFELFRRAGVRVAVVEVGLGGRFDATNVVHPIAGAITTIGLDHQEHLGSTCEAIAFEKAGIIKPGMTVIAGAMPSEARAVISRAATERGARLIDAAADVRVAADLHDGLTQVRIETPHATYGPLTLALRGEHQIGNALVAVRLLEAAIERGVTIAPAAIEHGLASAVWPARLELVALGEGRRVLLDAAHNIEGATALAAYLRRWHPQRPALVVGIMRDKDVDQMLAVLLPVVSQITATAAPTRRALPAVELAARISAVAAHMGLDVHVTCEPDPVRAVETTVERADTVCVAGSIFLVAAVRERLVRRAILH